MGGCVSQCLRLGWGAIRGDGDASGARKALGGARTLEVGSSELRVVRSIGEGGYSYVHLCKDPFDHDVAVKQTLVDPCEQEAVRRVVTEASLLRDLPRHPNIVGYVAHSVRVVRRHGGGHRKEVLLALEFCPVTLLGEMNAHVRAGTHFAPQRVLCMFADIAAAVAHLHSQDPPIAHRDIKVENVLQGQDGRWKLCDLGSASTVCWECADRLQIAAAEEEIQRNTTLVYRAPEQVDLWAKKRIDQGVDVWALGVVLFYAFFLRPPFEEQPLQIINCTYAFPPGGEERVGAGAAGLIRALLDPEPAHRPDIWNVSERLGAVLEGYSPLRRPQTVPQQRPQASPS
eukprot:TRINITY_DN50355_c0_g1_i1.p2 TRINITY_DN50355_c0_g1~~TRINITY_DN50355_c0_g1_i1.p2  ORF type:complete len:364 (+),score=128.45 TRINITY_DN50355_c0_g1_i1:66-1094(+)